MSERGGRALVAPLARTRIKLEAKGKVRPQKIARRLPAGLGGLGVCAEEQGYVGGNKSGGGVEEYLRLARAAARRFNEPLVSPPIA